MLAHLLSLPLLGTLIEQADVADVQAIYAARKSVVSHLAGSLQEKFANLFESIPATREYRANAVSIANRALRNLCLHYLMQGDEVRWSAIANKQYYEANNMTDQLAALRLLVNAESETVSELARQALADFYQRWQQEPLVVDQWFGVQAMAQKPDALSRVKVLMDHPAFEFKNPNKVRSLIGAFCAQNFTGFHNKSGDGYEFLADQVIALDALNPQVASRLLTPLTRWKKFDSKRQALMQAQLLRIKAAPDLSKDVFEIVEKSTVQLTG